jgi:hypothetical protein
VIQRTNDALEVNVVAQGRVVDEGGAGPVVGEAIRSGLVEDVVGCELAHDARTFDRFVSRLCSELGDGQAILVALFLGLVENIGDAGDRRSMQCACFKVLWRNEIIRDMHVS